jgi:hypothetical protein
MVTVSNRILLLHPPGAFPRKYQLDGYCSQVQKGPFRWHPLDFISFSSRPGVNARVLDLGAGFSGLLPALRITNFDAVIGLIGACGWRQHLAFWKRILKRGIPVFLSGDIARIQPRTVFDALPGLSGIIPELALPPSPEDLFDRESPLVWRPGGQRYERPIVGREFSLGIQDFGIWSRGLYRLPFSTPEPFASVITQVGCPHRCRYCILSDYSPAKRRLDEVREELKRLRHDGTRHVYIRDATLNSSPEHLAAVCDLMRESGFSWNAFARLDGVGEHARLLAASGCSLLQFGLDSPDPETLSRFGKRTTGREKQELDALRQNGIRSTGHYLFGLETPAATPLHIARTAHRLGLDWLTITPLMHRPGTGSWNPDFLEKPPMVSFSTRFRIQASLAWFYGRRGRIRAATRAARKGFFGWKPPPFSNSRLPSSQAAQQTHRRSDLSE